jgi:hypothetical protein
LIQEAGKDFTAGVFANREPSALLRLVEAMTKIEVGPAVRRGNGVVHLHVVVTEFSDIRGRIKGRESFSELGRQKGDGHQVLGIRSARHRE